ncbi:ArnT family glycosyltransferase [Patescibacteria group bacterium]
MKKRTKTLLIGLFILAFLGTRIPRLAKDVINPDGVNWHYRSQQFVVGLKTFDFKKTYQHYHPGVTLMWISGIPIEIYKQVTNTPHYDVRNFQVFDTVAKISVVVSQLILSFIVLCLLDKIIGFERAFLTLSLFTFEPFVVGNSRLYHMDILVTLILFIGLLYSFINLRESSIKVSVLSGLFLALAFLTKSIAIGGVVYVLIYMLVTKMEKKYLGVVLLAFFVFTFFLFPALWKDPIYFLGEIFREGERVGIRKGHGQILFGEYTRNAGVFFYPLVLLMKVSPLVLIGVILFKVVSLDSFKKLFRSTKEKLHNLTVFLGIFYLGYIGVMTLPSKKIDRYMLVVYPFLAYVAAIGFSKVFNRLKNKTIFLVLSGVSVAIFWIFPLIKLFPYYFTYTSPVFGSAERANSVIAQKPFGVGTYDLKYHIIEKYGEEIKLGFIDTKPMKSTYSNSKVFDVRVSGTSDYDLLVLGVNEEIPEKVLQSDNTFEKDSSLWINGLEYWRIYVKKEN